MSIDAILFIYVVLLLGALALIITVSELHRRRFAPKPTEDHIFRCSNCGFVYTDDPDVDLSRCSQCGQTNEPVKF